MKVAYAILAERFEADAAGRLSVHNIFSSLRTNGFPVELANAHLLVELFFEPEDSGKRFDVAINVTLPNGNMSAPQLEHTMIAPPVRPQELSNVDIDLAFTGLEIRMPGIYLFNVTVNGVVLHQTPLLFEAEE